MLISVIVGDWSKDGHEKSETYRVSVQYEGTADIEEWTRNGEAKLGFRMRDYCEDYEDNTIPAEVLDPVLRALGVNFDESYEDQYTLYEQDWFELWLTITRFGAPWGAEIDEVVSADTIHIGGYGLFY